MPLDPTETSPSLSFAGDEHLPCLCLSVAWVPGVSLSSLIPGSLFCRAYVVFWKIHISSFIYPNDMVPILLSSGINLVFIKNMKYAMFLQE